MAKIAYNRRNNETDPADQGVIDVLEGMGHNVIVLDDFQLPGYDFMAEDTFLLVVGVESDQADEVSVHPETELMGDLEINVLSLSIAVAIMALEIGGGGGTGTVSEFTVPPVYYDSHPVMSDRSAGDKIGMGPAVSSHILETTTITSILFHPGSQGYGGIVEETRSDFKADIFFGYHRFDVISTDGQALFEEIIDYLALDDAYIKTLEADGIGSNQASLNAEILSLGEYGSVDVFFRYRAVGSEVWEETTPETISSKSVVSHNLTGLDVGVEYEFKAVIQFGTSESEGLMQEFFTINMITFEVEMRKEGEEWQSAGEYTRPEDDLLVSFSDYLGEDFIYATEYYFRLKLEGEVEWTYPVMAIWNLPSFASILALRPDDIEEEEPGVGE